MMVPPLAAGGGGGCTGKAWQKKFVYLEWASHFGPSIQNFVFGKRYFFSVWLGGWFGLGRVGVRQIPPPPPVDHLVWYRTGLRCSAASMTLNNVVMTMRL